MEFEDVIYEKNEGRARISINRPKALNSFRSRTLDELTEAFTDASQDASVGAAVLTSEGGKAFCSGGDIAEMLELSPASGRVFVLKLFNLFSLIRQCPKPVIAAVDGYCLGGGNEINLVCDLTIATEKSVFGQVGPTVGSTPVLAGTQILPRLVGDKKAKEIIFLCGRYSAREALEMGWINKVVPDGSLEEETQAWVSRILEMSPQSLRISKTSLNFESDLLHSSYMHGIEMLSATYGSEELKEGMTSFMEKRKPDFNRFRK
ncbi:MAG TPA: enoyl-CoA hydratase-related protein [bacterium]|nr:enoyl-CoA hydratase-related protein [bacterium]